MRNSQPQRLGRLEIDDHLELGWLHDWESAWPLTLQNPTGVEPGVIVPPTTNGTARCWASFANAASMSRSIDACGGISRRRELLPAGQPQCVNDPAGPSARRLLSEPLTEGRFTSELSEGDVFGEMGLLEGATREASVTVVSADAEVLFMSTQSFHHLLHTMPAFAGGIWETAALRRELIRRP